MTPLELYIKQSSEREKMLSIALGSGSIYSQLTEQWTYKTKNYDLSHIFSSQKHINEIMNSEWTNKFKNNTFQSIETALNPLKNFKHLTDNINEQTRAFSASQILFSSSLELLTKNYNLKNLHSFNPILPAFSQLSKALLKNISEKHIEEDEELEELKIVNIVTENINSVTTDFLETKNQNIQEYLLLVIDKLNFLENTISSLQVSKVEKWKQFIRDVITMIAFISIFYNPANFEKDRLVNDTNLKTNSLQTQLNRFEKVITKNNLALISKKQYKCIKESNLYLKPDKSSKKIAIIKKGQKFTVIEVRRKYCCIAILPSENTTAVIGYININSTDLKD